MAIICSIFGLPGNILTIIVCIKALCKRKMNFERNAFDLYLAEISFLDFCLLLYWVIETSFHYLYSIKKSEYFSLMHVSAFSCFFFYMINRLFAALCSWLITCFTLIRFLNIFRPLNTIRSNIILVICLTIIFATANSYLMFSLGYDREAKSTLIENFVNNSNEIIFRSSRCHIREEYSTNSLTLLLNVLVAGFLNLVLPSMLTLLVNICIICYIKRIYNVQHFEHSARRSDCSSAASYRSTSSTLLVISMTYTLCYLPYCIIYVLLSHFDGANTILVYLSEISFIIRYISHSVNFYAYIFTSLRFRRDIISLFRSVFRACLCKKRKKRKKETKPTQQIIFYHYRLPQSAATRKLPTKAPL
ncbi:unnamed protein product [Rotaria magnacalcarata]|uniref:G-protein coupled receptors family 1 profile domain-containing protein n=2 Tax=Rotaria magnacalcarata TaxID=392030 RepID=A0A816DA38_9BILA|nr:unnamed protein product [Rotaria magnacalcarata]CAF1634562.1 unnamed protein product [Rotaria magnacalcarata]